MRLKREAAILAFFLSGMVLVMAQTSLKKVGTEAFSLSYDPGFWQEMPVELEATKAPDYFYMTLLRIDGKGMLLVMSHAAEKGQTLRDYAETSLLTNSIFSRSGTTPVPKEVFGRNTLYSTFSRAGDAGKVWFFTENGRNITFLTLDKDNLDPGLKVLQTLRVNPYVGTELSEEDLIAAFRQIQQLLAQRTPDRTPSSISTISVEIDPSSKTIHETIQYYITDPENIAWLRQYLSDTKTFSEETYPILSKYEQRAVDIGYTLRLKYIDANDALIGVGVIPARTVSR